MFLQKPFPELGRYHQCLRPPERQHFYAPGVVTVWSGLWLGGVAGVAGPTWCCKGI